MSDISLAAIEAAARRIAPLAVRTPLLESPLLNDVLGFRLLVKAEPLQRTGSFKFRGAYNRISQLDLAAMKRGVVAFSSGNHAQGVAHAAALLGAPAVIVMPADAPAIKIANTRAYGAEVQLYDRYREVREEIGYKLAAERGLTLVPPFDDVDVICGQGTVGLEIAEQCAATDIVPDAVLVCCGGGGLTAGVTTALRAKLPGTALYAVEPAGYDDTMLSLREGKRLKATGGTTFCDALMSAMPGEITFAVNRATLNGGLVVSDAEVETGMATAFAYLKLVVEPGGAVALTAAITGKLPNPAGIVVAVASGGNVDPALYSAILGRTPPL